MSTDNLRPAMVLLDEWREASGLPPLAIKTKDRPAMGYLVGEPSGHDEAGLTESAPLSSRVNFGKLIEFGNEVDGFRTSDFVGSLPVKAGFDFPIDVVAANGQAIQAAGARIQVIHAETRRRVGVVPVFEEGEDGAHAWSARFTDENGIEVDSGDVLGLVMRGGRILGDGKADQTLETGYWGMCDDNTGSSIVFGRNTDLPEAFVGQAADGKVYVRSRGALFGFDADRALELVYMDLPAVGGTEWPSNAGYRFGSDSSQIRWARGGFTYTNTGVIAGFVPSPFTQSHHRWIDGDVMRIENRADAPIRGAIRLRGYDDQTEAVPAEQVVGIVRVDAKRVKILCRDEGRTTSTSGELLTDARIDWTKARVGTGASDDVAGDEAYAEQGDTLQSFYARHVAPGGATFEQFREANRRVFDRPASSMVLFEQAKLPAVERSYTVKAGDTFRSVFSGEAGPIGMSWRALRAAIQLLLPSETPPESELNESTDLVLPVGLTLLLKAPERHVSTGQDLITLDDFYDKVAAPLGIAREQFRSLNAAKYARGAGWTRSDDLLVIPQLYVANDPKNSFPGDFQMRRDDGVDITMRATEVEWVQGETPYDLPFTHYLRFVQLSKGVWGQDGSLTRSISNGPHWVNDILLQETHGADRPDWAGDEQLLGRNGPLVRAPGDKIVFVAGTTPESTVFAGWYQIDLETGRVLNEGFTRGQPDFAWGTIARPLNWNAPSSYIGAAMPSSLRLELLVNGIPELREDGPRASEIAKRLNFPTDWRRLIVSKEEVHRALNPTGAVDERGP